MLSSRLVRYNLGNRGNGALNGTLYISSLNAESNIFKLLRGKIKDISRALSLIHTNQLCSVHSATSSRIKSNSIDYIFTDPPFGANIMYSELNLLWESWLNVRTDNKEEAIENKFQNKSTLDYQQLMYSCFLDYYRVLKPGKWMTVEFSNTSAAVWNGIQTAITNAGFVIANVAALDKKQGSFKAVSTVTAVKQDLVISCYKPSSELEKKAKNNDLSVFSLWDFVNEHLNHLPIHILKENSTTAIIERSPKILYDRLIAFYVQRNLPVPIDSGIFQNELRKRFIERDGMFFTNEQVHVYDLKKKEHPEFVQLSILVSSEQDGVLWLKNLLSEKALTYQEIQPIWMQALAGVRKGDIIPELADILEENFLKDANGKWYVANPENEADLEKLRNKRLLKQFETYKEEAAKPKGKIKEARVEALRVGFKHCYQDKDFKTIVQIGDRIPNNLLMEDEVLLQFYDIAISRV
jgi:DNA modification methylase